MMQYTYRDNTHTVTVSSTDADVPSAIITLTDSFVRIDSDTLADTSNEAVKRGFRDVMSVAAKVAIVMMCVHPDSVATTAVHMVAVHNKAQQNARLQGADDGNG